MPSVQGARLHTVISNFKHPRQIALDIVKDHQSNSLAQLILPTSAPPAAINTACTSLSTSSFLRGTTNLGTLISELSNAPNNIFGTFNFHALSLSYSLEPSALLTISSSGTLCLRVTSAIFYSLGLPAKNSTATPGEFYFIEVDLTSKSFREKGHFYQRVVSTLTKHCPSVELLIHAQPINTSNTASPIQELCPCIANFTVTPIRPTSQSISRTSIPVLSRDVLDACEDLQQHLADLNEWCGAVACGLGASSCESLLPSCLEHTPGDISVQAWGGLVSSNQVQDLINACREAIASSAVPWAVVNVFGFSYIASSWSNCEHTATADGTSSRTMYSLVIMPGDDYVVFKCLNSSEFQLAQSK